MARHGFIAVLAALTGLTGIAQGRGLEAVRTSGVLRVAADGMTPPFNYYKGKDLVGFEIELAEAMAKKMGAKKVEWVVQPFNTLLVAVNQDRFDLIATSHAINEKRLKVVDFTEPHYCTGAHIVAKPGGPRTAADLSGKVVVVPVGTVYYDKLKTMPGIKEVRTVPAETDGLQNLLSGRADAWVTDGFVAYEAQKKHGKGKLVVGDDILPQRNAMVVAKGNGELRKAANEALAALMKDGTYKRLSMKYFGRDIRCR